MKKTYCDVCEFDLTGEDGYANPAVEIKLLGAVHEKQRVEDMFGKCEFSICYICWLKSFGVKRLDKRKSQ